MTYNGLYAIKPSHTHTHTHTHIYIFDKMSAGVEEIGHENQHLQENFFLFLRPYYYEAAPLKC